MRWNNCLWRRKTHLTPAQQPRMQTTKIGLNPSRASVFQHQEARISGGCGSTTCPREPFRPQDSTALLATPAYPLLPLGPRPFVTACVVHGRRLLKVSWLGWKKKRLVKGAGLLLWSQGKESCVVDERKRGKTKVAACVRVITEDSTLQRAGISATGGFWHW